MPVISSVEDDYLLGDFTPDEYNVLAADDTVGNDFFSSPHRSTSSNENDVIITRPHYHVKLKKPPAPLQDRTNSGNTQRSNLSISLPPRIISENTQHSNISSSSPKPPYYKTINREKQIYYKILDNKSTAQEMILQYDGSTPNPYPFSCDAKCIQHVSYKLLSSVKYKPFDLDKLDITLNTESVLLIQIDCTLNGLDILEYPSWIVKPLNKVMEKSEFTNLGSLPEQGTFRFVVQKAFVTTPLSYLLEKQAPHGVLEKLYINLDFSTTHSKEFESAWKLTQVPGISGESMSSYIEHALVELITRRIHCLYPLIFSNLAVKEMTPVISYLPHISQSLLKVLKTAKATSPNQDFSEKMAERLKMIKKNVEIMQPAINPSKEDAESTSSDTQEKLQSTNLTLGLYYTVKSRKLSRKYPERQTLQSFGTPPDALEAIGKIWSVTCSSASLTSTEK